VSLIKNQLVIKGSNIIKVGVKFVRMKMKKLKEIRTLINIKYGIIKLVTIEMNGGHNIIK